MIPSPPLSRRARPEAGLLLLGHGSTENPDSSEPTWVCADAIRQLGLFAEVHCTFWKEEPIFRQSWSLFDCDEIFVVPNFISEGYFTRQVIPRELGLSEFRTTLIQGKRVHYCDPVGSHASMTKLLLQRAADTAPGIPPSETAVLIVGHGTKLDANSAKAIQEQVVRIRESGAGYAEVHEAYMEEAPFVAEWDQITTAPHVVVVPFFIADGLHSFQDIPVLLGLAEELPPAASKNEVFRQNPAPLRGRSLYYSRAIGTDPSLAEVILDQVDACEEALHQACAAAV
ncbi:MAG: CbiX/SirB N-terminal domain-containing protein [Verrucomicrobiales bacterium]|nr:cobalamin biosynthesis protein CbiX [Verrucomicrobiae bacterium]